MSTHPTQKLMALLDGRLAPEEAARVRAEVEQAPALAEELDLLQRARALLPLQQEVDPRPGFAVRVAALATEEHVRPVGAPWMSWAFGGGAALAGAAALLLWVGPRVGPTGSPGSPASAIAGGEQAAQGQMAEAAGALAMNDDFAVAQRLDFLEDLPVLQNQEALEELDTIRDLQLLEATP